MSIKAGQFDKEVFQSSIIHIHGYCRHDLGKDSQNSENKMFVDTLGLSLIVLLYGYDG